jgi:hypothetical protein
MVSHVSLAVTDFSLPILSLYKDGVDLSPAFMRIKIMLALRPDFISKVFNMKLCTQVRSRVINENR